ncbi:hypothetical protein BO71DRAFT_431505 [Aspergillus ellipticus CBS 707.79]|uniref:NWD NACHT-NTPase N-terminal domain-containing protein n=1 Tax=Aspergillus ellipticus CBS 707.79 TaxID=1448320 RepID=A0A319D6H6_9EURO|nr:hypothetical protein BO71DRAFT_431505 [Aspergillus ellipticus CBS 707.79]
MSSRLDSSKLRRIFHIGKKSKHVEEREIVYHKEGSLTSGTSSTLAVHTQPRQHSGQLDTDGIISETSNKDTSDDAEDSLDESNTGIHKDHNRRQASDLVLGIKDFITQAVKISSEASLAWAGVCVILPLLTDPNTAAQANDQGFTYVTSRMRYYMSLVPLLLPENQHPSAETDLEKFKTEIRAQVVDLYQHILDFQIRSVLRFYRSWRANFARDTIQHDNWEGMLAKVHDIERSVEKSSTEINTIVKKRTGEYSQGYA